MPIILKNPRRNGMRRRRNTTLPAGSEMFLITIGDVKTVLRDMGEDPSQFTDSQYKTAIKLAKRSVNRAAYDGFLLNGYKVAAEILLENKSKPLANPRRNGMRKRRNGMKRRRNMSKDEDMRRLRAKFRAEYGDKWAEDEDVYLDYLVEKKQARGSKQSAAEIKRIAIEKRVSERGRFK